MLMSKEDKAAIRKYGIFLEQKGYKVSENDYGIIYDSPAYRLSFCYERYGDGLEVFLHDRSHNDLFSVGWMAVVREGVVQNGRSTIDWLLNILEFTREHYNDLMNYQYCKDSDALIEDYIDKKIKEKPD